MSRRTVFEWDRVIKSYDLPDSDDEADDNSITLSTLRDRATRHIARLSSLLPESHVPDEHRGAHRKATEQYGRTAELRSANAKSSQ